ncbi:MAG: two-component system phosphate regulon response regulator PhoB [Devosia sp.]|jgi:two-component system, OmpR family, phosphate regulon response regulator PhoB|nr:response regulator [Devosia litorisediminis]|tara:strand:- start:240 stop:797 length:558 start_codon:yes stop_codon:yes gene_type:complete
MPVTQPAKVVAIIAANPALSSLLAMVVAGDPRLNVRIFESEVELIAFMRVSPIHMLVCDFDREGRPAYEMVESIRLNGDLLSQEVPVIALTRHVTPPMRHQAISAGIDEVIIKPMSPRYLFQRIQIRLRTRSVVGTLGGYRGPERRNRIFAPIPTPQPARRASDNVVPLFPDRRKPQHPVMEPRA